MASDNELTRPAHYGGEENPFEPIKIIEHYGLDFNLGNAIKYILRAGTKENVTPESDLTKAEWYVGRAVSKMKPQDPSGLQRLADFLDEESYFRGMQDAASSPSTVLRAIVYALQESGFEGQFVAEADMEIVTKMVEVERVRLDGVPGFMVRVVDYPGRVEDMVVDEEVYEGEVLYPEAHSGDPGDEIDYDLHNDPRY